ncbi:MAG: ATP-dependent helicase [Patescibacteria group bacterium]|nr:ATP-dependent helicase [Patescibacteria group bacterium]MDD4304760.1 ATP-dependent helicase [Patescibacteria group bacterium]MDD4695771.1 ATP-dependent helicase [Patescibacteria group bacterium]
MHFCLMCYNSSTMVDIDFKKELNEEQYKVVSCEKGPCLVLAGAGSGKTRTLVYRVAWLLSKGINPEKILLVTFTNKAANEMLERVKNLLSWHSKNIPIWGGTFHSLANRLLRIYGDSIGIKKDFTIIDADDSKTLIKNISKDFFPEASKKKNPSPALVREIISFSINSNNSIGECLELKFPEWRELLDNFIDIEAEYQKRKKRSNLLDFDDLLFYFEKLSSKKDLQEIFSKKWDHVLVDEYQDTNYLQAKIIHNISRRHQNVIAVGDDAQSIYSFRAADIKNILDFPKVFENCKIYKLETNYRSTTEIVNLANKIIKDNDYQFSKNLKSVCGSYIKPELLALRDNREEARTIVDKIRDFLDDGMNTKEIVVLFRAGHQSQTLEMELNKCGIAYEMRGGLRFFERAHVKDVISVLRIINNFKDEISWSRVLQFYDGIGNATIEKIYNEIKNLENIDDVFNLKINLSQKAQAGMLNFLHILKKVLEEEKKKDLYKLIRMVTENYYSYLMAKYPDYRQREEDLNQLAIFASNYESLEKFLSEVALQESFNMKSERNKYEDKIVLSTVHQAKGLEWDAVFLINLTNDSFPHSLCTTKDEIEEERRLFYVAITRAKRHLILTYPMSVFKYNELKSMESSDFIKDLDNKFLNFNEFAYNKNYLSSGDIKYESNFKDGFEYLPSVDDY